MKFLLKFKKKLKTLNVKNKKNGMGFTLIEALVVTAVIAIISSIMVVNWRQNQGQYQLQRAAQEMAQIVRKAQDYALTSKKMWWSPDNAWIIPLSYGVHFEQGETQYFIYGDKQGNAGYQNPEDIPETYTQLETGIEIDSLDRDPLNIIFNIPDGDVSFYPANAQGIIVIKKTGKTCPSIYCRTITVQRTGEIDIQ